MSTYIYTPRIPSSSSAYTPPARPSLPPEQVVAFTCLSSVVLSAAPLFVWWSRIRFSCPLDLVVRSFGLGVFTMFWLVVFLFYLAITGPMGSLMETVFGERKVEGVSLSLSLSLCVSLLSHLCVYVCFAPLSLTTFRSPVGVVLSGAGVLSVALQQ